MATTQTDSLDANDFPVDICLVDTDQYSHPYITSIFAHVAKFYHGQDRHHFLEGFSKIAKMYDPKDGRIAMDGWNCIHYGKDKNGRLVSGGREWTLKKICDTVNNPTTLREFVIAESFFASCSSGKPETCPPDPKDLPRLLFSEAALSFAMSAEMIRVGSLRGDDTVDQFSDSNTMRVCDTSKELQLKAKVWIFNAKRYLEFIGVEFDEKSFSEAVHEQFSGNFTEGSIQDKKVWIYGDVVRRLDRTHNLVEQALDLGLVKGYIGGPGRGKTHCALSDVASAKNAFGFALSNTVAFSMKKRGITHSVDVEPYSFSRVLYRNAVGHNELIKSLKHPIMIDETSQMGIKDMKILDIALEAALENNVQVILMGDMNQIPSFLSRGSVLYSLYKEFPDLFTELTVNHRVDETSRDMVAAVDGFSETGDTSSFRKYQTDRMTVDNIISDCDNDTVFICGSNYQASCTSQDVLQHKVDGFAPCFNNSNWFSLLFSSENNRECIQEFMRSNNIKFRATTTATYVDICTKAKFKIRTNEEYLVTMFDDRKSVAIESLLTKEHHVIGYSNLCIDFEPAYAITANRAQGLEWDTVVVMYGDYYKRTKESPNFKGNYPIRNSFEHLYVSCSRARKQMFMYYGRECDSTLVPLTKYNMFNIF